MRISMILTLATLLCGAGTPVLAQSSQSTQATSPGQAGANTLPQAPSGGTAGRSSAGAGGAGTSASGPTPGEQQADQDAKKATAICKGC
jgi:hypothetical protein